MSKSSSANVVEQVVNLDEMPFWKRPYYWEFVDVAPSEVPRWQRSWHLTRWAGEKVVYGMEFVGEIVAELIGLNRSSYQWVIDTVEEDERRRRHKEGIDARRKEMIADVKEHRDAKQADHAEGGQSSSSDDE